MHGAQNTQLEVLKLNASANQSMAQSHIVASHAASSSRPCGYWMTERQNDLFMKPIRRGLFFEQFPKCHN